MTTTGYILLIVVSIISAFLGSLWARLKQQKIIAAQEAKLFAANNELDQLKNEFNKTKQELSTTLDELQQSKMELVRKDSELDHARLRLKEQQEDLKSLQERFNKEFEVLANRILEEKSKKFTEKNKENIQHILDPLKERIQSFEKKVDETHKDSIEKQSALRQQIKDLKELNSQMSKDAVNLTRALKGDSKKQGDWGEFQLETILQKAGLIKDVHYTTQETFRDDELKLKKPDFLVKLPDNKHLVIDSKVSLTAYERFFNSETDTEEQQNIKLHLLSLQKHIKELSEKKYEDLYGINSPDYVMMFVPIEPALMIALQEDQNLYIQALERNVVLVSTTTLLATLSTVASIWKQEDQKKNVIEIARQAGALYDKFEGLVQDLLKIGKQINASQESYQAAMNKISQGRGNLISRVEKLKTLGAKTKKALPEKLLERANEEESNI